MLLIVLGAVLGGSRWLKMVLVVVLDGCKWF